ncbi:rod-binding protein [Shimia sp. SDUM112013]|uniref:rod-binding protein n=1 Tax=Shimia sp. SDUM112013 TaxID=3136160 RepID=UPI0032EBB47E
MNAESFSIPSTRTQVATAPPLKKAAQELEATFLAEMLKSAGLGETKSAFQGGVGEDQFASFLREEQARQMAQTGGIGLAELIFDSMKEQLNGR